MKGDSTKPEIVGYVIDKDDNVPEIEKALKEVGVKLDAIVEDGDVLVLKQGDADLKSAHNVMVKFSPDFMVVCKGLATSGGFSEILKTQGFMPGPGLAAGALHSAVSEALVERGFRYQDRRGGGRVPRLHHQPREPSPATGVQGVRCLPRRQVRNGKEGNCGRGSARAR